MHIDIEAIKQFAEAAKDAAEAITAIVAAAKALKGIIHLRRRHAGKAKRRPARRR